MKNNNLPQNKKRQPLPPKKKKKGPTKTKQPNRPFVRLSDCALQYAMALSNPWKSIAPCIPDGTTIPSTKMSFSRRGVFAVGTQGVGFIVVNPFTTCQNDGLVESSGTIVAPIVTTNSSYANTGILANYNAFTVLPGIDLTTISSPFTLSSLSAADNRRAMRLVGCGVKVSYVGTELNLSGQVITASNSQGTDLSGIQYNVQVPASDWLRNPHSRTKAENDRRIEHFVTFVPGRPEHNQYSSSPSDLILRGSDYNVYTPMPFGYCMGICIDGAVAGSKYTYEVIAHWEIIGDLVTVSGGGNSGNTGVTPSHSDPIGVGGILSALPTMLPAGSAEAFATSLLKAASNAILTSATTVIGATIQNSARRIML